MMLAHPSPPPSEPDVKLPGRRPVQGPCKAPDGVHICPGRDPAVRLVVVGRNNSPVHPSAGRPRTCFHARP